jgi:hypothetical protein
MLVLFVDIFMPPCQVDMPHIAMRMTAHVPSIADTLRGIDQMLDAHGQSAFIPYTSRPHSVHFTPSCAKQALLFDCGEGYTSKANTIIYLAPAKWHGKKSLKLLSLCSLSYAGVLCVFTCYSPPLVGPLSCALSLHWLGTGVEQACFLGHSFGSIVVSW